MRPWFSGSSVAMRILRDGGRFALIGVVLTAMSMIGWLAL
jgi:hypothetical protein